MHDIISRKNIAHNNRYHLCVNEQYVPTFRSSLNVHTFKFFILYYQQEIDVNITYKGLF